MRGLVFLAAIFGCGGTAAVGADCPNAICGAPGNLSGTAGAGAQGGAGAQAGGGGTAGRSGGTAGGGATGGGTSGSGAGGGAAGSSPGALDLEYFKCRVEPILDRGCSMLGCHGTEAPVRTFRVYSRGRMRNNEQVAQVSTCPGDPRTVNLAQEGSGTVMCVGWSPHTAAEWQKNFDSARAFATPNPDDSDLLAQPVFGGRTHAGVHLFSRTSQDYGTIRDWLAGAQLGGPCDPGRN